MSRHLILALLVSIALIATRAPTKAEIPPESRDKADFVITGVVRGIYLRDEKNYHTYIVELTVDEVDKGKKVEPRDTFYVSCYKRKASAPPEPSPGGHRAIPKEGHRIKAFVKDDRGQHNAIYPNWFDEATPARKE
jgi:hypothetical protein